MAQDTATYKLYVHLTLTGGSQEAMAMSMAKVDPSVLSWRNIMKQFTALYLGYISFNFPFPPAGSYFARDAKYSSKFCHTTGKHNTTLQRHGLAPPIFASEPPYKTMFLARVLVGEYTVGHPMYCRPPSKDASFTNFYDSCVDDMANPKIYVIFDSNQIYPEYLIEFYWSQRWENMYFFLSLSLKHGNNVDAETDDKRMQWKSSFSVRSGA